jgi:hypothetical protein
MSRDAASGSVPVRDPEGRVVLDRWGNHIALTPVDHRAQNDATTLHTIFFDLKCRFVSNFLI